MAPPDYEIIQPLNRPEMLISGTFQSTDLDRTRLFLEEFYRSAEIVLESIRLNAENTQ